jgi:hypothetical protein
MTSPNAMSGEVQASSYTYLWEFRVKADRQQEFERHYGPEGPG